MNKIDHAISEINQLHYLSNRDQWMNHIHPLVKFVITLLYIILVVSFDPYQLSGLLGMLIYPLILFELTDLKLKHAFIRMRLPLFFVIFIGIFNPIFNRTTFLSLNGFTFSYGFLSMISLTIKGIFTLLATYLLIATTTIEQICYSLSLLHIPKTIITVFLLIIRYISVLLEEVSHIIDAYSLRAPMQKGIHFKYWGSLVGQLLLRSIDRANEVYQSMCLRGFDCTFSFTDCNRVSKKDVIYLLIWIMILFIFRIFPVFTFVGSLFI